MKTINKLFLPLVGILLVSTSCQDQSKKENQETPAEEIVYKVPEQIISLAEADSLFVNYKDRRASNIMKMEAEYQETGKPFVPTEFVTFDIEVLKKYIGYVEQEAKNGGVKADSLRIYLGNYGNTKNSKSRQNTVFLLPTANTDAGYGGIYIDDGDAKLIRDYWKNNSKENGKQKSKASFMPNFSSNMMYSHQSLILNYGHCCSSKNSDF